MRVHSALAEASAQHSKAVITGQGRASKLYSQTTSFWWLEVSSPMMSSLWPCIMDRLSGEDMAWMSQVLSFSTLVLVLPHTSAYMAVAL